MRKCNLVGTKSFEEVIEKIKTYSKNCPMPWIYGRGWDQNDWEEKNFPNRKILDSLFPNTPVFLKRIDGHAALVNQKVLDLAKINSQTKINGGDIEIKNNRCTGILVDNAMDLVEKIIPHISDSLFRIYLRKADSICTSQGLTMVHDCGISERTANILDEEQKKGNVKLDLFALLNDDSTYYESWIKRGVYKTDKLIIGGFKVYTDGALGSRGACLLQPYSDKKNHFGFLLNSLNHFNYLAEKLSKTNLQMCTHAIGDSANRVIMDVYSKVLKPSSDKRWRIEHCQVVHTNDLEKFRKYKIIPSVQPTHATSDMYWAEERLGKERIKNAYAYKDLLKASGILALGTDFPVEEICPLKTFYASAVRKDVKGFPEKGFQIENSLSRIETLKGMTIWGARASFTEKETGSLEKNKKANFIILDKNLLECPEEEILNAKILETFIDGKKVF